jgi:hypothetical protein
MIVGIFDAPLMCSWAGNLAILLVSTHASSTHASSTIYGPCYAFDFWYLARIKNTTIRASSACWHRTYRHKPAAHLYEMPLYVVPTSNARTSFRRGPLNADRDAIVERPGKGGGEADGHLTYICLHGAKIRVVAGHRRYSLLGSISDGLFGSNVADAFVAIIQHIASKSSAINPEMSADPSSPTFKIDCTTSCLTYYKCVRR